MLNLNSLIIFKKFAIKLFLNGIKVRLINTFQIYQSSPDLRRNFDPNLSYGESHGHNTALHYAAKHGMKHLLR